MTEQLGIWAGIDEGEAPAALVVQTSEPHLTSDTGGPGATELLRQFIAQAMDVEPINPYPATLFGEQSKETAGRDSLEIETSTSTLGPASCGVERVFGRGVEFAGRLFPTPMLFYRKAKDKAASPTAIAQILEDNMPPQSPIEQAMLEALRYGDGSDSEKNGHTPQAVNNSDLSTEGRTNTSGNANQLPRPVSPLNTGKMVHAAANDMYRLQALQMLGVSSPELLFRNGDTLNRFLNGPWKRYFRKAKGNEEIVAAAERTGDFELVTNMVARIADLVQRLPGRAVATEYQHGFAVRTPRMPHQFVGVDKNLRWYLDVVVRPDHIRETDTGERLLIDFKTGVRPRRSDLFEAVVQHMGEQTFPNPQYDAAGHLKGKQREGLFSEPQRLIYCARSDTLYKVSYDVKTIDLFARAQKVLLLASLAQRGFAMSHSDKLVNMKPQLIRVGMGEGMETLTPQQCLDLAKDHYAELMSFVRAEKVSDLQSHSSSPVTIYSRSGAEPEPPTRREPMWAIMPDEKVWVLRGDHEFKDARELRKVDEIRTRVLQNRGLRALWEHGTVTDLEHFPITPESMGLSQEALENIFQRLLKAAVNDEGIYYLADYDNDGFCSAKKFGDIMRMTETAIGKKFRYEIVVPDRRHGYGLQNEDIRNAKLKKMGLIVTGDNGITAHGPIDSAGRNAIDVVVIDHHQLDPDLGMPEGEHLTVLHSTKVCATSIMSMAEWYIGERIYGEGNFDMDLKYAAWATMTDVMPFIGEATTKSGKPTKTFINKAIVHMGLEQLNATENGPIVAMLRANYIKSGKITPYHLSHILGPQMNAQGRIGNPKFAVDFISSDKPAVALAADARKLKETNKDRRTMSKRQSEEALKDWEKYADAYIAKGLDPPRFVVLGRKSWHPGVVGLIATEIRKRTGRPTLICTYALDTGKDDGTITITGSARGAGDFSLPKALKDAKSNGVKVKYGGHDPAAGVTLHSMEEFKELRKALERYTTSELITDEMLIPKTEVDCLIPLSKVPEVYTDVVLALGPWGPKCEEPRFASSNVYINRVLPPRKNDPPNLLRLHIDQNGGDVCEAEVWVKEENKSHLVAGTVLDHVAFRIGETVLWGEQFSPLDPAKTYIHLKIDDFSYTHIHDSTSAAKVKAAS